MIDANKAKLYVREYEDVNEKLDIRERLAYRVATGDTNDHLKEDATNLLKNLGLIFNSVKDEKHWVVGTFRKYKSETPRLATSDETEAFIRTYFLNKCGGFSEENYCDRCGFYSNGICTTNRSWYLDMVKNKDFFWSEE